MGYVTPADVGVSDNYAKHIQRNSVEPGTDYKTAYGTDIRMADNGVIILVDNSNAGADGRRLSIQMDNGEVIDYIHGSRINGHVNQRVSKNQKGIFISGASGYGNDYYYGSHVHVTRRSSRNTPYKQAIDFEKALESTSGGGSKPFYPTAETDEAMDGIVFYKTKNDSITGPVELYALAGSGNGEAAWLEISDPNLANALVANTLSKKAVFLSKGTWEDWKKKYLGK